MGIENLPVLKVPEPLNLNGGNIEVEEGEIIPRRVLLEDPSGRTMLADITHPVYAGGNIHFCYSRAPDSVL